MTVDVSGIVLSFVDDVNLVLVLEEEKSRETKAKGSAFR